MDVGYCRRSRNLWRRPAAASICSEGTTDPIRLSDSNIQLPRKDAAVTANFFLICPTIKAQGEQQEQEIWLSRDDQRQSIRRRLDVFCELKKSDASNDGQSTTMSAPPTPEKNGVSMWDERRLKSSVQCRTSQPRQ
ncbi:hypothetical protein Q5P01_013260 [Channa striata]|uniref:Uncharacterized protein n=1 Tax=Channa striata TaxID=64152 RepID=A0AA88SN46_CHASR|nr:hypothetical protein Q5P01_013260 [Channa striata]